MPWRIKADVIQALDDWKAGKPVRSLELGHVHRMKESNEPTMAPSIDTSKRIYRDQERAHAYLFHIIEWYAQPGAVLTDHDSFMKACDILEKKFAWGELPVEERHTFDSEREGAESLAWKALIVGWVRAIEGHADSMYITVTNPAAQPKAQVQAT